MNKLDVEIARTGITQYTAKQTMIDKKKQLVDLEGWESQRERMKRLMSTLICLFVLWVCFCLPAQWNIHVRMRGNDYGFDIEIGGSLLCKSVRNGVR